MGKCLVITLALVFPCCVELSGSLLYLHLLDFKTKPSFSSLLRSTAAVLPIQRIFQQNRNRLWSGQGLLSSGNHTWNPFSWKMLLVAECRAALPALCHQLTGAALCCCRCSLSAEPCADLLCWGQQGKPSPSSPLSPSQQGWGTPTTQPQLFGSFQKEM